MTEHEIGRVYVRRWPAEPATRLVVIVHGYGEHIGRYAHVAEALAAHGSVVVGPDHIGHGRSPGERALIEDFEPIVEDVRGVVEAMRSTLPVVMIGHSMGGLIAIRYAQRYGSDLAGLVLSGPAVGIWDGPEVTAGASGTTSIDVSTLSRDPAVGAAYAADELVYHGGWKRPTLAAFAAANERIATGPGFGGLPVLYLHGEDDQLVPAERARAVIVRLAGPRTEQAVIEGARHEIFNELDNEVTIATVARFIDLVTPG